MLLDYMLCNIRFSSSFSPIDCSGCLQGSYRCHIQCYTYDCVEQGDCNFVNQEEYCDDNDDVLCSPVEK